MKKGRYVPLRDTRLFQCHVSPERARAVAESKIDWEDLTIDDLLTYYATNAFRILLSWALIVKELFGEEACKKALAKYAEKAGTRRMQLWLERFNTDALDSEQMAYAQDLAHIMYGPSGIGCYCQWEDDVCVARRTSCPLNNAAKELGIDPKICLDYCDNSSAQYEKVQPGMKSTRPKAMPLGDPYCEHVFSGLKKAPKAKGNPGKPPWPDEVKD